MPKLIRNPKPFKGRSRSRIDWDKFADGQQYRLVAGKDFDRLAISAQSAAHQAAARRGMIAKTMIDGDDVIVQFFPDTTKKKPAK